MKNFDKLDKLTGIFPAALTMFDHNGNLDEQATWRHADWLIKQGVQGLVAAGTSGEFIALKFEEHRLVLEIILDAARNRVPVIASTGFYSTNHTIEMTQWAEEVGAAAALVILPYYQRPSKDAVIRHYRLIAGDTNLPIMVYNNPANSACQMMTSLEMLELADEGVVHGVKSTMATTSPIVELKASCPNHFRVFYGSFMEPLQAFCAGAHGWISGILNLIPMEASMLQSAIQTENNLEKAREIWFKLSKLVQLYFYPKHGHAADLPLWRAGLELRGYPGGYSRSPFFPITKEQRSDLEQVMREIGLIS